MTFSNRKFGVEIEFTGVDRTTVRNAIHEAGFNIYLDGRGDFHEWSIVYDGSVTNAQDGGGEAVSPILSGLAGLEEVAKVAKIISQKGGKADRSCGLHVHIDASDILVPELHLIAKRYARFENEIDNFMPRSRRGNSNNYCYSMNNNTLMENIVSSTERSHFYDVSRYHKLNLNAYYKHSTIEFRQHSGTINAHKIVNWVKFCISFIEESRKIYRNLVEQARTNTAPVTTQINDFLPMQAEGWDKVRITRRENLTNNYFRNVYHHRIPSGTINIVLRALFRGIHLDSDSVYTYSSNTVRNVMSALRNEGFVIQHPRGTDYYILDEIQPRRALSDYAQNLIFNGTNNSQRTESAVYTNTVNDALFAGMEQEVVSFYQERAVELA
jgi:hypothetical protein